MIVSSESRGESCLMCLRVVGRRGVVSLHFCVVYASQ
jgi:hypothetical protein